MHFTTVRLRSSKGKGKIHKKTHQRLQSGHLFRKAGQVLCNTNWAERDLELIGTKSDCRSCAKREKELT